MPGGSGLRPQISVQRAILDRFANVVGGDVFGIGEVGDGAGDLEDAIVSAGAEVQLGHGHLHHAFGGFVEGAMALEELGGHAGVAADLGILGEALALDVARFFHALADGGGGLAGSSFAGDVPIRHGGDFDVDVDAVEERAGDAVAVTLDIGGAATALAFRVAEVTAFAGIRCLFAR